MPLVKKRKQIDILADTCFFIYIFTEFIFKHTKIGQVGVFLLIVSVLMMIYEKRRISLNYYFFFSILFIVYNYLNTFSGDIINVNTSLEMINTLIKNYVILFFVYNYLVLRNDIQKAMHIFIHSAILFSFIAMVVAFPDIFSQRLGRDFSFFGLNLAINSNTLAIISSLSFLMCYYEYLHNKSKANILKLLWFSLVVLLSGSRKGLFILCMGSIILVYLLYPNKRTKNILSASILFILFYLFIMNIPSLYDVIGIRIEAVINYILGQSVDEGSLSSRVSYTQLGWNYFKLRPWSGYGLDNFRHFPGAYHTYSHNNFIEILVSGGVPAMILYYSVYIIIIIKVFNNYMKGSNYIKLVLTITIIMIISDYAMVSYFDRIPLTILMFSLAMVRLDRINSSLIKFKERG